MTILLRLINLIAEDHAIEDTIYHLHRALNDGRLDLDKFLKVSISTIRQAFWLTQTRADYYPTCRGTIYEESPDREDNVTATDGNEDDLILRNSLDYLPRGCHLATQTDFEL